MPNILSFASVNGRFRANFDNESARFDEAHAPGVYAASVTTASGGTVNILVSRQAGTNTNAFAVYVSQSTNPDDEVAVDLTGITGDIVVNTVAGTEVTREGVELVSGQSAVIASVRVNSTGDVDARVSTMEALLSGEEPIEQFAVPTAGRDDPTLLVGDNAHPADDA